MKTTSTRCQAMQLEAKRLWLRAVLSLSLPHIFHVKLWGVSLRPPAGITRTFLYMGLSNTIAPHQTSVCTWSPPPMRIFCEKAILDDSQLVRGERNINGYKPFLCKDSCGLQDILYLGTILSLGGKECSENTYLDNHFSTDSYTCAIQYSSH